VVVSVLLGVNLARRLRLDRFYRGDEHPTGNPGVSTGWRGIYIDHARATGYDPSAARSSHE